MAVVKPLKLHPINVIGILWAVTARKPLAVAAPAKLMSTNVQEPTVEVVPKTKPFRLAEDPNTIVSRLELEAGLTVHLLDVN